MTQDGPFALLAMPSDEWRSGMDLEIAAVKCFDPANPGPLIKLLESSDLMISRRGLWIFQELGRKGAVVLDAALKLYGHPHDMARNALMNGVMCYSETLNAVQARTILKLVNDPFVLVREKVMIFFAYANLGALEEAVASLDESLRSEHRKGLDEFSAEHPDTQLLFDEAIARDDIWSAYAFASLVRMTRKGMLMHAPEYAGESCVAKGVVAHVKMLIARRDRTRRRKSSELE